jgi:hypothetical protein
MSQRSISPSTRTGEMPRLERPRPDLREALERPTTLPEMPATSGATTGVIPVVTEGSDKSAGRDNDAPTGK